MTQAFPITTHGATVALADAYGLLLSRQPRRQGADTRGLACRL